MDEKQLNRPKTRYYVQSQNRNALAANASPTRCYSDNNMDSIKQNYQNFLNNANYPMQDVSSISRPILQRAKQLPAASRIHNPNLQYSLTSNNMMQGQFLSRSSNFPIHQQPMMQNQQRNTVIGPASTTETHIHYPPVNPLPQSNIVQPVLTAVSPKQRMLLSPGSDRYNMEMMRRVNLTNQVQHGHSANFQATMTNQMIMSFNKTTNQQFGTWGSALQNLEVQNTRSAGNMQVMRTNLPNNVLPELYKVQSPRVSHNRQHEIASQTMQHPSVVNMKMDIKTINIPTTASKIKDEDLLQFTALGAKRKAGDMGSQSTANFAENISASQTKTDSDVSLMIKAPSSDNQSGISNCIDFLSCMRVNKRCKIPDGHKLAVIEYRVSNEHYSVILKHLRALPTSTTEHPIYTEISDGVSPPTYEVDNFVVGVTSDHVDESDDINNQDGSIEDEHRGETSDNSEIKQEVEKCSFLAEEIQLEHEKGIIPIPIRNYEDISWEEVETILNILTVYNCKIVKEHKLTKYRVRTFIHADGTTQNQFLVYTNVADKGTAENTIMHQFGTFNVNGTNKFKSPLFSVISCSHANPAFLMERRTNQPKKTSKTTLQHYQASRSFDLYCEQNNLHFNVKVSRYGYGANPQSRTFAKISITCPTSQLPLLLSTIHSI